jgi:hypothetical protein
VGFARIKYHSGQGIFKVRLEDESGALMENWVFMEKDFPNFVNIMCKKYGFKLKKPKKQTDLDWAKGDLY